MDDELKTLSSVNGFDEGHWHEIVQCQDPKLLYAPHKDRRGRFFNPWLKMDFTVKMLRSSLSFLRTKTRRIPSGEEFVSIENTHYQYCSGISSLTFLGHASFVISMDNKLIFTDPFFSKFAALMKKSVNVTVDYCSLPKDPVVLISHNHYDHMDRYSIKELIERNAVFIVPLGLKKYFLRRGAVRVHELDWWQSVTIDNVKYTFLPAQHWSLRVGQPRNTTLWGSFMIEGSKNIYFSGDTGYFIGFREFGKVFPKIDLALLAVGASYPRWQRFYQHQGVDEFFMALDDLGAGAGIPMHYGTIKLGKESVDFPGYEVQSKLDKTNEDRVKIMKIGETLDMNDL